MIIEAVTVCVNYGDFLKAIVPFNLPSFDRWIVVTEAKDEETRMICAKYGLTCLLSEEHHRDGELFNKGQLVDRGLQLCSKNSWRLHLDSDIVLPTMFKHFLKLANPDTTCLHGVDRININSWDMWQAFLKTGWLHHSAGLHHLNCIELPKGVPVGARWCSHRTGYVPLGYFQLWHASQDELGWAMTKTYPTNSGDACHSDTQHGMQWDRRKRVFIPEIIAVHLDSEKIHTGANWHGRKTRRFGPVNEAEYKAKMANVY